MQAPDGAPIERASGAQPVTGVPDLQLAAYNAALQTVTEIGARFSRLLPLSIEAQAAMLFARATA